MQVTALLVGQVITVVIGDQIDDGPVRQGSRLVENKPPVLDTCSQWTHATTVRSLRMPDKPSVACRPLGSAEANPPRTATHLRRALVRANREASQGSSCRGLLAGDIASNFVFLNTCHTEARNFGNSAANRGQSSAAAANIGSFSPTR